MTHYSTLPMVFYFSEQAPLYISYSSLLFKPPCIPSYFSSFRIELRTGPLLIPNRLLTLINSSAIVFDTILKKYTKSQRCIILINSSSLGSEPSLTPLYPTRMKREWLISTYYWALWKWHMKEIHEDNFKFVPLLCLEAMMTALQTPCPILSRVLPGENPSQAPNPRRIMPMNKEPEGAVMS